MNEETVRVLSVVSILCASGLILVLGTFKACNEDTRLRTAEKEMFIKNGYIEVQNDGSTTTRWAKATNNICQ